jgi:hypothetical protein
MEYDWERSTLRSKPVRGGSLLDGLPFAPTLVQASNHPMVLKNPDRRWKLLANKLCDVSQQIILLEETVVMPVCKNLWKDTAQPADLRRSAHRMTLDELYHTFFFEELIEQVHDDMGRKPPATSQQDLFQKLGRSMEAAQLEPKLALLILTCTVETVLGGAMTKMPLELEVSLRVREVFRDHSVDEATHCVLFTSIFKSCWATLSPYEREQAGKMIASFIHSLTMPNNALERQTLTQLGFSAKDAEEISDWAEQKALPFSVLAQQNAGKTIRMLREAGALSIPAVADAFAAYGLLVH